MGQTSVSSLSQQQRPEGGVDGLDKPPIANSDGPNPGNQSPPLKRRGKLSTIGKIFKPWKWRKKKASEKFRETSAVLERKISTRQSREELIRRGLLKELPDQDGDVPVNLETSNGHMIVVSEEPPTERKELNNIGAGNGSVSTKAQSSEEKTEANSSQAKKTPVGKTSSSSPSSTSRSKASKDQASKDQASTKAGTSGTPRANKKPAKQLSISGVESNVSSSSKSATPTVVVIVDEPADNPATHATDCAPDQPSVTLEEHTTEGQKSVLPPKPPESPVLAADNQPSALSDAQDNEPMSGKVFLLTPALDCGQLLQSEPETESHTVTLHQESFMTTSGEITICCSSVADDDSCKDVEALSNHETTDESSDASLPPDSESEGKENTTNDSDSDGPILYTDDDDDDEDDDESGQSSLASKIRRKDSLAIKLGNRPSKKELEDKNILQRTSEEERQEKWQEIGTKLVRRLSQRPTTEELEQRNILRQKNEEEEQEARRELKRRLTRKLSLRPSVAELVARRILRFNEYVEVTDSLDYDRRADKPWARLTPADKAAIRKELNEFKSTEMAVHEESRQFTRFHRP